MFHSLTAPSSVVVPSSLVMNGSSLRRPKTPRTLLVVFKLALFASPVAATICTNASTLFKGELDATAIVYDGSCNVRTFQVSKTAEVTQSLNLSNLNIEGVSSYPRVHQLILNNNQLETFAPADADDDMKFLELASNSITSLSSFRFPRRLTYLDLSQNSISTLSSFPPWPEAGELQTLLLNGNSLSSVSVNTFTTLVALQSLSLSNTGISNLDKILLPFSLRSLSMSNNLFTSASTTFVNLPTALHYLDLSNNLLTDFPAIVSSLTTLVELNLESNGIKKITRVTFASTLRKIYINDNPLSTIEICRSDVSMFQSLSKFVVPSSVMSTCGNSKAKSEKIKGVYFCVLEDDDCDVASSADSRSGSLDSSTCSSSSSAVSEIHTDSLFSAKSIGIIGGMFFIIGLVASSLVFGLIWHKQGKKGRDDLLHGVARKGNQGSQPGSSEGNSFVFTSSGKRGLGTNLFDADGKLGSNNMYEDSRSKTPGEDAAWSVYESPFDTYYPVALLESSAKNSSIFGASTVSLQARSKIKSKIDLDDLLVFEIPPEEIQMRHALNISMSKMKSKAALALSSAGVGSVRKVDTALFLADYQGYKVVIQALMRCKKRLELRFVEQIRLAASLDHASIVHFIGVTTGCSTTFSRRRGSSAAVPLNPYASHGLTNTLNESKSRFSNMGAPAWHLGVVFEYMQHGSLASMFEAERHRREGKGVDSNNSVAVAIGSGNGNFFSWYPVFANSSAGVNANPNADWRCKLSIALDVAMGLVYLHANNYAHGSVCAHKVLVNEQGEAKLSAMDVVLASDLVQRKDKAPYATADFRGSLRESARWTMQKISSMRPQGAPKATKQPTSEDFQASRHANHSRENDGSRASEATLDGHNSPIDSLEASRIAAAYSLAQRDDVYAFGTFLWELDTMIAVEEDMASCRIPTGTGGSSQPLTFSADCPMELQKLACQCWHEVATERPSAIEVQEELVRMLEGRLTTIGQFPPNWTRPSCISITSGLGSDLSFNMSSARTERGVALAEL